MSHTYTLLVDESGEAGIKRVRSDSEGGASPYMTLGAVVLQDCSQSTIKVTLEEIQAELGKKTLHCNQLGHYQLLHYARRIIEKHMRFFGVISRKATLDKYKDTIEGDSSMYYNKCTQYLLERVGWFMEDRKIPAENLNIIFEKANTDYDKMKNFLRTCQQSPIHQNTKRLKYIDVDRIEIKTKDEEPLLKIADLVAHALYKCVDRNPTHHEIPEPRYLKELAPRFFGIPGDESIIGAGIYCVHSLQALQLDYDVEAFMVDLKASSPT